MRPSTIYSAHLGLLLLFAICVGYLLLTHTVRRASEYDTLGYVYAGERLAAGHGLTYADPNNVEIGPYFSLNAFRIARSDDPTARSLGFPPGLPLLLATSILATGRAGALYFVTPLLAFAGLWITYALAYLLTRDRWSSFFAAVLLASTASFWRFGTETWSEFPSLALLVGGAACYWYSRRADARWRWQIGLFAGLLLGYAVWIRYANVMVLAGVGLFELLTARQSIWRERWRWTLYGPIIASLFGILIFNHYYYGGAFLTSYSPENGWYVHAPFSFSYAFGSAFAGGYSAIEGAKSLWQNFGVSLLLLPIGLWALDRKAALFLAAIALPVYFLYSIYAFPPKDINSRFLIIIYPAIATAIGYGWMVLLRRWLPPRGQVALGGLAFGLLLLPVPPALELARQRIHGAEAAYHETQIWVEPTADNAVFMTYLFNDRMFALGDRSVLNYRHMVPYDSAQHKYLYDQFIPCFIDAIDTMLVKQLPVYFIEDQQPTFYDAYTVLEANYELQQLFPQPNIVQVVGKRAERETIEPCTVTASG